MSIHLRSKTGTCFASMAVLALVFTGCNSDSGTSTSSSPTSGQVGGGSQGPTSSTQNPTQGTAPVGAAPQYTTAVLLYNGDGVSASEEQSDESILTSANISFTSMTSAQINALTPAQLATYGMIFVPGGEAETMSQSLTAQTITMIQNAVNQGGMGYFGICAGAFLAGDYGSWGLGLTSLGFNYYAAENQGITEEATEITFPAGSPNGTEMDMIWYGGPMLDGFGSAIGKYSDGTIAIAQAPTGNGFVMLSGVHPDAPDSWRTEMNDTDTDAQDFAYVVTLVQATLTHTPLPSF